MIRNTRWKVALVVLAALFGILFTAPNFLPADMRAKLPGWFPHKTLNLGLDLQGGSRLVYQVDTPSLIKERLNNQTEDIRRTLSEQGVPFSGLAVVGSSVELQVDPAHMDAAAAQLDKLRGSVRLAAGGATPEFSLDRVPPTGFRMTMLEPAIAAQVTSGVDQAIQVINKRINLLGTREPVITRQGRDRIVIEAAGESDPEKLKNVIGKTAKLTFQLVDDSVTWQEAKAGHIPPGSELFPQPTMPSEPYVLVKKQVLISGDMLTQAMLEFDPQTNQPAVGFRLNGQGTGRFAQVSTDNVGKRFAIVLDNKVIEAPVIRTPITGGQGQISGSMTPASASELALLLNSGALPVQLNVIEQSSVGAGLGLQAIQAGEISLAVGAACIFAFIILAYGLFGVFAAIALFVNVLLILALMSVTQATLTLPGIAGVILTLAVAVDANVLVYERMRDEARANVAPMMAADHGYRKALISIVDANITTLIAAAIMFQFGSGPVKGFAWTLAIGVLTSVFTALLITQVLIGWWFKAAKPKQLPI